MKIIQKLCGTKKTIFNFNKNKDIFPSKNKNFICKKCLRTSNDEELLCYPEIVKSKKE